MAMPRDPRPMPKHPAVNTTNVMTMTIRGHTGPCYAVTCPVCQTIRWLAARALRKDIVNPNFTGACRTCWLAQPTMRRHRSTRNASGRRINQTGYAVLNRNAIADYDLDLFDRMRRSASFVSEHRWLMAKHLGRALETYEYVDHLDGVKDNNAIENLRIYRNGRDDPGACPGYGTYYHEWQMALLRIRELEALLSPPVSNRRQ